MTSHLTEIRIDAAGPFDLRAALDTLIAHTIDGLHRLDIARAALTRWIEVANTPHLIQVQLDKAGAILRTFTRDAGVNEELTTRVRHWFDLDTDLTPVNAQLSADPIFSAQVATRPGVRITRFHAAFEAAVLTVLGQQVSLAAGRLFGARLVAAYGATLPDHSGIIGLHSFPTPRKLVAQPVEELRATIGLTGARARTVHEVAELFASEPTPDALPTRSALQAVYGIGPWTLEYLAIRADTDPDAFPISDAVLRRTLRPAGLENTAAYVDRWRPYRSYAACRLWAAAVGD